MVIQSKRAKQVEAYIESHKTCAKGKQKVEINGKIELLESYLLPISLLQYNHNNRRFNLEIQEYEEHIKRTLDPTDKDDLKKIKELLLQDETEAKKLKDDLEQLGEQREVAAITYDGVVINGNRRMAIIEELHEKYPAKWTELWAVRLPEDISEKDLWKIEAGLQLSKEKVADYGPVNNLLMIKEGKKAGLTYAEIAASMYGWSEKQVKTDLERLNLIETFLQFFGQPNNYGLIKKFRLHEHFIDLQKGLVERLNAAGAPKKDILNKMIVIFAYLRQHIIEPDFNITHIDVRNQCKALLDNEAYYALTDSFEEYKDIKQVPVDKLSDNLDRAVDVKKNRDARDKPVKLIERAIAALKSIDKNGPHYKKDDVKKKLKELDELIKKMKTELGMDK